VRRPVIGLCAALERARWTVWDERAHLLPASYADAVQRAGGLAVLLPPDPIAVEDPDPVLDILDGLILAGGADIDPATYGAEPHPETAGSLAERDAFEIALTRRALERDLATLGICRGMQLMNVATGGTLLQHVPESHGHEDHRRTPGSFDDADHDVRLQPGSLAARTAGETVHSTKSHHHQGVDVIGDGLVVTGWSALDELPETLEAPARSFVLGVQWHPEVDEASRIIGGLVEEARRRGDRRAPGAAEVRHG
jgi:putative glutamine amidotransferase